MSVSKTAAFLKEIDDSLIDGALKPSFVASRVNFDNILDSNAGNYNLNMVNFSSLSSAGIQPDVLQSFSQAYLDIPIELSIALTLDTFDDGNGNTTLDAADVAKFGFDTSNSNVQRSACSIKNNIHLFDYCNIKFGNVEVANNNHYINFYRRLKMLEMPTDTMKTLGPLFNYDYIGDSGRSIQINGLVGEINNKLQLTTTEAANLAKYANQYQLLDQEAINGAHYRRCKQQNQNVLSDTTIDMQVNGSNIKTYQQLNKIGGITTLEKNLIKFHWNTRTPLALIHDFFNALPSTGPISSYSLSFGLNTGIASSVSVKYTIASDGNGITSVTPTLITVTNSSGNSCPYMLGELGKTTGLNLKPELSTATGKMTAGTYTCTVKLTSAIGSKTTNQNPCAIVMPSYKYDPQIAKEIFTTEAFPIYFNDFIMEERRDNLSNLNGTTSFQTTFTNQFTKCSKLYIIPFLSTVQNKVANNIFQQNVSLVEMYQSCLSSAPETFNKGLLLSDLQMRVGNTPIFPVEIRAEDAFYHQNLLSLFATKNDGNLLQSAMNDTQLTYDKFKNGYGVYAFDMTMTTDPVTWAVPKTYSISFRHSSKLNWSYYFIFEQAKSLYIDRATGLIVNKDGNI